MLRFAMWYSVMLGEFALYLAKKIHESIKIKPHGFSLSYMLQRQCVII